MDLRPYLRAHGFLKVEQPPLLWEAATREEPVVRLLGEMIVVGLLRGNELGDLVLSASNIVIEESAASDRLVAGDYVGLTVSGAGDWRPEATWWPGATDAEGVLARLDVPLRDAGVRFAYTRGDGARGSVTAFLPRAVTA